MPLSVVHKAAPLAGAAAAITVAAVLGAVGCGKTATGQTREAQVLGLAARSGEGTAVVARRPAPPSALAWREAHPDGPVVPSDVSLVVREGPCLVTFAHTPTDVRRHTLSERAVLSDGRLGAADALVATDWSAFPDPFVADLTGASYLSIGDRGILVWDTAIPMALNAAVVKDGAAEPFPVPNIPAPYPGLREGQWAATAMRPDLCIAGDRLLLVAQQERGLPLRVAASPLADPGMWSLYTDLPGVDAYEVCPAVTAADGGALLVAATALAEGQSDLPGGAPGAGRLVLHRSEDGETWSEPMPTVDESKAHSSALAADDDVGLIMVYTAEREDGWPLLAARSPDFGETWGEPVMLTEPTVHAFRPDAMLHDGILYVAYLVLPDEPARDDDMGMLKDPVGVMALTLDPTELPVP